MKAARLGVITTLLLLSFDAVAELPEFIVPITDAEEASARAKHEYFVKKSTYFAKRFRIVVVNAELLASTDQFSISLFDDLSVSVEVDSLKIRQNGVGIGWSGRYIDPATTEQDLIADGYSVKQASVIQPHINSISITAAQISFDDKTETKYQYFFPDFERYIDSSNDRLGESDLATHARLVLYDVTARIQSIHLPSVYELRPIESDARYHLLIELDPEKTFAKGPMEDPEHPEQASKRQAYRDFIIALGPDPRLSNLHESKSP